MTAFTNTFSWSASRDRLFRTCPRAYYYNYYAYWNGWSYNADEETKTIYKLKKLQGLPLWAGSIVHDVIQCFLELQQAISGIPEALDKVNPNSFLTKFQNSYDRETAGYKKAEDLEEVAKEKAAIQEAISFANDGLMLQRNPLLLKAMARLKLREGFKASLAQSKKFNNKALYLFEHYYEEPVSGAKFGEVATKIYTALENFCTSKDITNMLLNPAEQWRSVDELTKYNLTNLLDRPEDKSTYFYTDIPIWCAIDFAYTDFNGDLWIVDWKTGKENSEELKIQLASYAIFAQQEWKIPFEKIHLCGVFLNDGGLMKEYKLTADDIETARQAMAESARKMLIELENQADNETTQSHFPCDPDDFKCRYCNFKGICNKKPILDKKEQKLDPNPTEIVASTPKNGFPLPETSENLTSVEAEPIVKPDSIESETTAPQSVKESEPTPVTDFFNQSDQQKPDSNSTEIVASTPKNSTTLPETETKPKKKTRLRIKTEENKKLKAELNLAKKNNQALTASNLRNEKALAKANDRAKLSQSKITELKGQVKSLKGTVAKKDRQIASLTNSKETLKQTYKSKHQKLSTELSSLRKEIRAVEKALIKSNEKLEKEKALRVMAQSKNAELQKKLKLKTRDMVYQPSLFEQDYSHYSSSQE